MKLCKALKAVLISQLPLLLIIFIQTNYAGMTLISKAAFNDGMNPLVFNAYRKAIATIVMAPFAFLLEKKKNKLLSFHLFCKIFLLALCGPTVSFDLYYVALRFTSATFASTIFNTTPVITFIISILLRMEAVKWCSFYGGLKIAGMFIAVGGAMVLSFYRGPPLKHSNSPSLMASSSETFSFNESVSNENWIIGPVLMFFSATTWSLWLVMQTKLLKLYPAMLRLSTLQYLFSSVQSTMTAAAFVRNLDSWKIEWNIQLASLVVFITGVSYGLQIWCAEKKGPFYVAMFFPLSLLTTAIFSHFVWAEKLSFGSLLAGFLIVGGLYCVLWGRSKEGNQVMLRVSPEEKCPDVERQ